MPELLSFTLVELAAALRAKKASPGELLEEVFAALDRENPELNAVVAQRDRDALRRDAQAAEARITAGRAGPLEGIPFGVKDLEDAAGLPTTHGSQPFRQSMADMDSTQVTRLKAAGAIVLGKTNTPEFGAGAVTKNPLFGPTRSPWDPARTPGGSSGGSAAALAAELLPLVTASDGGGSIRIPASFVGAFGLKPSYGRVPRGPLTHWFHGATETYGPLTKTVADAALFLDVVAGYDAGDPTSLPRPARSYLDELESPFDKLRIAYSPDLGHAVVQSDVAAVVEEGVRVLESLGHQVATVRGGPPPLNVEWGMLAAFETGARNAHLRPAHDAAFGRALVESWNLFKDASQSFWARLMTERARVAAWCARVFAEHDLLVTPTVPYDPPPAKGPYPHETEGRAQVPAGVAAFTIPFNLSWHPAATVRAGLSRAGLPVGLQLVAPHHREDLLLRVARAFERERPAHPHWPLRRSSAR